MTTWQNINGTCDVYAKEFSYKKDGKKKKLLKFSTSLGRKNENDEWDNMYLTVQFKQEEAPEIEDGERVTIDIKEGFLSFDIYENKQYLKIVVLSWDYPKEEKKPKKKTPDDDD